jgi:hypothetical protein
MPKADIGVVRCSCLSSVESIRTGLIGQAGRLLLVAVKRKPPTGIEGHSMGLRQMLMWV